MQCGMQPEGQGAFGPGTTPVTINVVPPPPLVNNAQVSDMGVQPRMQTKLGYTVSVTMRNSGTTTWAPGSHVLGSENPVDNVTWGLSRVALTTSVAPGQN